MLALWMTCTAAPLCLGEAPQVSQWVDGCRVGRLVCVPGPQLQVCVRRGCKWVAHNQEGDILGHRRVQNGVHPLLTGVPSPVSAHDERHFPCDVARACSTHSRSANSTGLPYSSSCAPGESGSQDTAGNCSPRGALCAVSQPAESRLIEFTCVESRERRRTSPCSHSNSQQRRPTTCAPAWLCRRPGRTCRPLNTPG